MPLDEIGARRKPVRANARRQDRYYGLHRVINLCRVILSKIITATELKARNEISVDTGKGSNRFLYAGGVSLLPALCSDHAFRGSVSWQDQAGDKCEICHRTVHNKSVSSSSYGMYGISGYGEINGSISFSGIFLPLFRMAVLVAVTHHC